MIVSDVATLLYHARISFQEAKTLLGRIEMERSPSLTWDEKLLGEDRIHLDNDPIHLDVLRHVPNGLTYDQVAELTASMKRPEE